MKIKRIISALLIGVALVGVLSSCKSCDKKKEEENVTYEHENYDPDKGIDRNEILGYIVKDETSDYVITYGKNATECEKYASEELAKYIGLSTGTTISVKDERALVGNKKIISIGFTEFLKQADIKIDETELNGCGFIIKTVGETLFIAGAGDRGTLYGVYDYLEKILGIRFFDIDCEKIPENKTLPLYKTDVTEVPAFRYAVNLSDATYHVADQAFTAKCRYTHEFLAMDKKYGGNLNLNYDINTVHNNLTYVPVAEYYNTSAQKAENAHMFYISNGDPIDICYSDGIDENGSVDESMPVSAAKAYIEGLKKYILKNPSAEYYTCGQEDITSCCTCEKCSANFERFGYTSATVLRFYNAVAKEIQAWADEQKELNGKQIKIVIFAYYFSAEAPVTKDENGKYKPVDESVVLADNVVVRFADITSNVFYSTVDDENSTLVYNSEYFERWKPLLNNNCWYWTYTTNHTYFYAYTPTLQKLKKSLVAVKDVGCEYALLQANSSDYHDWKAVMENYVCAELLWNPYRDVNALRNEFIDYYYGAAAEDVRYVTLTLEEHISNLIQNVDKRFYVSPLDSIYLPAGMFEGCLDRLQSAKDKINETSLSATEKEEFLGRIDEVRLTPLFYLMWNRERYYLDDAESYNNVAKEFFETSAAVGAVYYGEHRSIASLKSAYPYS